MRLRLYRCWKTALASLVVVATLLAVVDRTARADKLYLRNGKAFVGKVTSEIDEKVTIKVSYGMLTFRSDDVV